MRTRKTHRLDEGERIVPGELSKALAKDEHQRRPTTNEPVIDAQVLLDAAEAVSAAVSATVRASELMRERGDSKSAKRFAIAAERYIALNDDVNRVGKAVAFGGRIPRLKAGAAPPRRAGSSSGVAGRAARRIARG